MSVLADALQDSGGRATLITTRRPKYGVGALRDREKQQPPPQGAGPTTRHQQSNPYKRASDEQQLFTPLQRLVKLTLYTSPNDVESTYVKAGFFYRQLGERCAIQCICIDIVVTSSLFSIPPASSSSTSQSANVGPTSLNPNVRGFLDIATMLELCRATCGKFKWLRVGNECGVKVGDNGKNGSGGGQGEGSDSLSGEQL